MKHGISAICSIVLLIAALLASPHHPAYATGEFQADYDVQYAVTPTGKTIVTQHVTLTNKLSNYYPKQYSLLLDSDKITNVIAYDDGGVITPTISIKGGKTDITLSFNAKNIGLGKSSTFSLRYEHAGIASQNGNIWEIYVPGITNDPDIGQYDVSLSVPPTFGPAAYIAPRPNSNSVWTKDQMIRGGIAAAYGTEQHFDVSLRYSLSNHAVTAKTQSIALPPDTAFQKVTLQSLMPKPDAVERDADGNWLAHYELLPAQTKTINAKLAVTTYLSPRKDFKSTEIHPEDDLKPHEYWEVTNPAIQALAKTHKTARSIYSYVASALSYDYSRVNAATERLGAAKALESPDTAVCTEFTDLFIAIARAAGIPARRNVGYAYTNNPKLRPLSLVTDVLHAWPEYYDETQGVWIPVDPTWANTTGGADYFSKLDFNHIVFAVNGADSTIPYPAGFYHSPGTQSKDVTVEFATSKPKSIPSKITSSIEFPSQVGGGTAPGGSVLVQNEGGESAYTVTVDVESAVGGINVHEVIPELLPYASVRVPFSARLPQVFSSKQGIITAHVNDATITHEFSIQPLVWLIAAGSVLVIAIVAIVAKLAHILVWKRFKKR